MCFVGEREREKENGTKYGQTYLRKKRGNQDP